MKRRALITGGCGFVGANLADRLARDGMAVRLLDNLSRTGSEENLQWLRQRHGAAIEHLQADLVDRSALHRAVQGVDRVFHLAAQVAVTTSLLDPVGDLLNNGVGTVLLIDELRRLRWPPVLVFSSTNKVYGALEDIALRNDGEAYRPCALESHRHGISESRPLDLHSPYGCSKGAADQYVIDAARSFGLATVVLRMSCVYGPQQHGTAEQGWVAHFLRMVRARRSLTIYGDGCQVRDLLYIDDLVEALLVAPELARRLPGRAFNIGGGPGNAVSLRQVLGHLERMGHDPRTRRTVWRVGDQRWYVTDTRRFREATGWQASTPVAEGLRRLDAWLAEAADDSMALARRL